MTPPGSAPLLEARELCRDFGPLRAVDRVGLTLASGEVLALFGPNGAGKTSLLRLLAGSLKPTSGEIVLHGERRRPGDPEANRTVGVLSHRTFLYGHLTAAENLRFFGRLFGLPKLDDRIRSRLDEVGLLPRADDRVRTLSRGMRQRLALARALLHDPALVLLDEPFTGLDLEAAIRLARMLEDVRAAERSVVLVTHDLHRGRELADRVGVMVRGRLMIDRPAASIAPSELERLYQATVELPA